MMRSRRHEAVNSSFIGRMHIAIVAVRCFITLLPARPHRLCRYRVRMLNGVWKRNDASFRASGSARGLTNNPGELREGIAVPALFPCRRRRGKHHPRRARDARQPRRAASMAAMSIFCIVIIASNARLAAARSGSAMASVSTRGVICHDSPHLSLHQPHALS